MASGTARTGVATAKADHQPLPALSRLVHPDTPHPKGPP
jgi:hypothetical protein